MIKKIKEEWVTKHNEMIGDYDQKIKKLEAEMQE